MSSTIKTVNVDEYERSGYPLLVKREVTDKARSQQTCRVVHAI